MKVISLVLVLAAALFAACTAEACCVYNHSRYPLGIYLYKLPDNMIGPTHKSCTRGTGGKAILRIFDGLRKEVIGARQTLNVDDHGWISVYQEEGYKWRATSKDKHGHVKETVYLKDCRHYDCN